MTDDTGDDVPMTGPTDDERTEPTPWAEPTPRAEPNPWAEPTTVPGADATSPGWASPPAWGSTPSAWPTAPTPPAPPGPPATPAPGYPAASLPQPPLPQSPLSPPFTPPGAPSAGPANPPPMPAGGGGGGAWTYGYGGMWAPPPEPAPVSGPARRIVATIAIVALVLFSGIGGAVISAAVHGDSKTPAASAPFNDGSNNTPSATGNGSGGTGNGAGTSAVASKVNPALVNIYTTINTGSGSGEAAGSGMVITPSGEVLTNNHVIADSTTVRVELVATGSTHTAKVLGYDVKDDVALLKIDGVSNLNTVSFADARKVAIGDAVVAIGNAGGRGGTPTVSSGSVTALDQKVTAGDQGTGDSETLTGMIEISAPIEPGDSGGALVNSKGQVIGMNTAAATSDRFSNQSGSTTAFAIPINRALTLIHQMENAQESANVHIGERGLLGIRVQDISQQLVCPTVGANSGALIAGVQSGTPADSAGLGACDVIVSVGGKNVATTSDLNAAMFPYHPSEKVDVGWIDQSGQSHHASVALISGPPV